jgi:hypothetical protein
VPREKWKGQGEIPGIPGASGAHVDPGEWPSSCSVFRVPSGDREKRAARPQGESAKGNSKKGKVREGDQTPKRRSYITEKIKEKPSTEPSRNADGREPLAFLPPEWEKSEVKGFSWRRQAVCQEVAGSRSERYANHPRSPNTAIN